MRKIVTICDNCHENFRDEEIDTGMEYTEAEYGYRVSLDGIELELCSLTCLKEIVGRTDD